MMCCVLVGLHLDELNSETTGDVCPNIKLWWCEEHLQDHRGVRREMNGKQCEPTLETKQLSRPAAERGSEHVLHSVVFLTRTEPPQLTPFFTKEQRFHAEGDPAFQRKLVQLLVLS